MLHRAPLRVRQKLGKYRIDGKLGDGAFAAVYKATDTLEGVKVALKVPYDHLVTPELLEEFRHEVRIAARLKHENILPLKNADFVQGRLVLAYPLGERTLAERLQSRMAVATAMEYSEQVLAAAACAHEHRVIHCDIKPENIILFPGNTLMLGDFGIAKVALRTIRASGSGTVGFCAPEQAMGKPSFRSDVFSLGLVIYRMLSGHLPEWPFEWPPPGYGRLRKRVPANVVEMVRRAIEIDPRKRFSHAGTMLSVLRRVKSGALQHSNGKLSKPRRAKKKTDWKTMRRKQFQRQFGRALETHYCCAQCDGPVAESMTWCPWCGAQRAKHLDRTRFPQQCPRCYRGLKLDWAYCPWCYGAGFEVETTREFNDSRYTARCGNSRCPRKVLMPFMRYCPWCRRKVRRKWKIEGSSDRCPGCSWGVVKEFWRHCAWCGKMLTEE